MRKLFVVVLILLAVFTYADRNESKDAKAKLEKLLMELEDQYIYDLGYKDRRAAIKVMDQIMELLDDIDFEKEDDWDDDYDDMVSDKIFDDYLEKVASYKTDTQKLKLIEDMARKYHYTSEQLLILLEEMVSDKNKLTTLTKTFGNVVDKKNYKIFLPLFKNSTYKKSAEKWLKNYDD